MWLIGLRKLDTGGNATIAGADVYTAHTANTSGPNVYAPNRSNLYAATSAKLYATTITAEAEADRATGTLCAANATRFARGA
jgi:hypothetical protein